MIIMKTDTELMRDNLKKNKPEYVREGDEVKATLACGCGYSGKAPLEVYDEETGRWYAYCKCEM